MEMALRSQKIIGLVLGAVWSLAAQPFEFAVLHDHAIRDRPGRLRIADDGVSYTETQGNPGHVWSWKWEDIQQLSLSEDRVILLTYEDSKWRLGVDREYCFRFSEGPSVAELYRFLQGRLDQRLVAKLAEEVSRPLWEIPAKLRGRLWGSHGALVVGEDRIVYRTPQRRRSRTWRYMDIDNISSSGPFELIITTFERSRAHYGNRKAFVFQLKRPLSEACYDDLWRRLRALPSRAAGGVRRQRE